MCVCIYIYLFVLINISKIPKKFNLCSQYSFLFNKIILNLWGWSKGIIMEYNQPLMARNFLKDKSLIQDYNFSKLVTIKL